MGQIPPLEGVNYQLDRYSRDLPTAEAVGPNVGELGRRVSFRRPGSQSTAAQELKVLGPYMAG